MTTIQNMTTNILKVCPISGYAKGDRAMIIGGPGQADGVQTLTSRVMKQLGLSASNFVLPNGMSLTDFRLFGGGGARSPRKRTGPRSWWTWPGARARSERRSWIRS